MRKKTISSEQTTTVATTPYELFGGEGTVRQLAERFYDIMESDPAAKELLDIHPQPMGSIRQRFFEFLSGWLGGPPLFEAQYGHPRLRARHLPFTVDAQMRDQWMYCMNKALDEVVDYSQTREEVRQAFTKLATHMINQE